MISASRNVSVITISLNRFTQRYASQRPISHPLVMVAVTFAAADCAIAKLMNLHLRFLA